MDTRVDVLNQISEVIECEVHFVEGGDGDPPALEPEAYELLDTLLNRALQSDSLDPLLWFWRGWACQFLKREPDSYQVLVEYENAEAAYLRALEIDPQHGPAAMMLTLPWARDARRKAQERAARKWACLAC